MLLVWLNCSTINILSAMVNCTMTAPIMTWSIWLYFGVWYAWLNSTRHASLNCIALRMFSFYECSNLCKSRSRVPTLKLTSVTQFTRYSINICYSHYQYPLPYTHVRHKAGTLLVMKWLRGKLSDTILLTLPVYLQAVKFIIHSYETGFVLDEPTIISYKPQILFDALPTVWQIFISLIY